MLNFACKKFKITDVIQCSLGLTKSECKLFRFLLYEDHPLTAQELAKKFEVDRTTIQKSIKNLVEKGIVKRLQENLSKGGYIYRYEIKEKTVIKNHIKEIVTNWYNNVIHELDKW